MLTCNRPALSLARFAVGSIEYSLSNFRQLRNFLLAFNEYTHLLSPGTASDRHLPAPDTVSERVCRWLDRVFYLHLQTASILSFSNPQIYSIAIVRQCLSQCLSLTRSCIPYGTLDSYHTSDWQSTNMLTCHRPTVPLTGFAAGSIEYSLCNFRQIDIFRIPFHTYDHLPSPDTVSNGDCRCLDRIYSLCIFRQFACFRLTIQKYTHLPSPDTASGKVCHWLDRVFSLQL